MAVRLARPTPGARRRAEGACARALRRLRLPQALFPPVMRPRRDLAAASAPACLSRMLRTLGRPVRELATLCAWTEQAVPPPRLVEAPLFGSCLEELVRSEPGERQPEGDRIAARSPPSAGRQPAGRHRDTQAATAARSAPPRPWFAAVADVPRPHAGHSATPIPDPAGRAPLALLTRRAGGFRSLAALASGVKVALPGPSPRPPLAAPRPLIPAFPRSAWVSRLGARLVRRFGRYAPGSVAWSASDATAGWPQGGAELPVTAGTRQGVHPRAGDLPLPTAGHLNFKPVPVALPGSDVAAIERPAAPAPAPDAIAWIGRSWVLLTSGPQAPRDLLLRLAGGALPAAAGTGRSPTSPAGSPPNRQPPLLRGQAERAPSGVSAWDAPFSQTPRQAAPAPETLLPTGAQQGFYPQAGSLPLPAAGQPNFRPPLAPPVVSDTPPTLLAPQAVFDAPTPHAAASLRQAGRHDEEAAPEDLDRLAARIKRILDDEARRYGIHV